jgi:hypothetical protein
VFIHERLGVLTLFHPSMKKKIEKISKKKLRKEQETNKKMKNSTKTIQKLHK